MNKKIVLITGASSGIGKVTAMRLHEKGWKVYGTSRTIVQDQFPFCTVQMDITSPEQVREGIKQILHVEKKIDVLINSAGYGIAGAFEETSQEEAKEVFETNFFGLVSVTQEVLKSMRARKSGTIVNISSISGVMGLPFQSFYSATKYAVEGISEALSLELAPWNVKVILIEPGDVSTEFTQNRRVIKDSKASNSDYKNQFQKTLKRIEADEKSGISPEQVAEKVVTTLSRRSPKFRYVSGLPWQRFAVILKKMVPTSVFKKLMSIHYEIR